MRSRRSGILTGTAGVYFVASQLATVYVSSFSSPVFKIKVIKYSCSDVILKSI